MADAIKQYRNPLKVSQQPITINGRRQHHQTNDITIEFVVMGQARKQQTRKGQSSQKGRYSKRNRARILYKIYEQHMHAVHLVDERCKANPKNNYKVEIAGLPQRPHLIPSEKDGQFFTYDKRVSRSNICQRVEPELVPIVPSKGCQDF
jgi:hypothetical protein